MEWTQLVHPTAGGLACAVGAVVAGAPLFSGGLRAWRLRRQLGRLRGAAASADSDGLRHLSGTVVLESPLFAPLSARPCAGFRLELRAEGAPITKSVEARRPFRLVRDGALVRVEADGGRWALSRTVEREVAADEPLSGTLTRCLERAPEVAWWRRAGGRLRLVEHALVAGASCHVVGCLRSSRALEMPGEVELVRTGTDPVPHVVAAAVDPQPEPWLGPGDLAGFTFVSDREPDARDLAVPRWWTLGLLLGPALSLLGLLYLAAAADALRSPGRF